MASGLGISIRPFPLADRPNGRAFLALAAKSNLLKPRFDAMFTGISPAVDDFKLFIVHVGKDDNLHDLDQHPSESRSDSQPGSV